MGNDKEPLVEATPTEPVVEEPKAEPTQEVAKTYTQEEVDEMLKGKFTQEQVNEIVEKRLNREKDKQVKAEPVVDTEQLEKVKADLKDTQSQLEEYKKKVALAEYEIDEQFKEFVDYKVSSATNSEKDYATALKEFMGGDGAKYLKTPAKVTMPRPENTNQLSSEEIAEEKLKRAFGL